ncbi:MAG TPA: hypothetical protein VM509_16075 [Planctomycetota bacterium]|nr:hypothetical protein [Planctomycetota bacterium]
MKRILSITAVAAAGSISLAVFLSSGGGTDYPVLNYLKGWPNYAHNSQHAAVAPVGMQTLNQIHWQTPVDLAPQYSGNLLLIHYGSPLVTARNNVLIPVKTTATGAFRVESRKGSNGALNWQATTDYVLPSSSWTPSFGPTLTPNNTLVMPAIGGTVLVRHAADQVGPTTQRWAFYGLANYNASPATYNSAVKINTPITSDTHGNVYFGFTASATTPAGLVSGIARMDVNGNGSWISATNAAVDASVNRVQMNCAPALSNDGAVLYIAVKSSSNGTGFLVGLNSTTLAPLYKVRCKDPKSGNNSSISDLSTGSPSVGPDGEVYFGVNESGSSNNSRGWMLHYNSTLTATLTPGAFGWDDTASIFPSTAVPQYTGTSPYLLLTKYNNYAGTPTGDGLNKVAVLDPHATMIEPVSGIITMKEILVKVGPTPDPPNQGPGTPNAVREWCINTVAVDAVTHCALVNNEDGKCYRWDFATNTLNQVVTLTAGIGEAYTPTIIGPDGQGYAINNAILFALGQ